MSKKVFHKIGRSKWLTVVIVAVLLPIAVLSIYAIQNSARDKNNTTAQTDQIDTLIQAAQARLDNDQQNPTRYGDLCQLYLQKIRQTADTSLYSSCDELLDKANKINPDNESVVAAQASVAYGRHDFSKGLMLSQKASKINPDKAAYYGLIGDGQLELGMYDQAIQSIQTMIDKKPELSAFNRVAYLRELYGDIDGAKAALVSAISAGSSFPENVAFSQVELGKLQARSDLDQAERSYMEALRTEPDYPPALEALGRLAFARGDTDKAVDYFNQAFTKLPLAQYAANLGDVYMSNNDGDKADSQYFLANLAFDESTTANVNIDYERSLYLSQRDMQAEQSLELAKKAVAARPNIFSFDTLAWAYYRNKNYAKAEENITKALVLGQHEPVILYHAGLIAKERGDNQQARTYLEKAFAVDQYFLESHFSINDRQAGKNTLESVK